MSYMGRRDHAKAKDILKSAVDLKPQDKSLRHLLTEGCRRLAEEFAKGNQRQEAKEIAGWAP